MKKLPDLTEAEFEIMEILWNVGESSTKKVVGALPENRKLAYNTVATVLTRLREKGYVGAREQNFAYVYSPLVEKNQVVDRKLDDLVTKVLGGNMAPLAVYIAKKGNLSQDQIQSLEDIVKSRQNKED